MDIKHFYNVMSEWTQKFEVMFLHLRSVHPPYFHITDSGVADFDSGNSRIVALVVDFKLTDSLSSRYFERLHLSTKLV